MKVCLVNTLYYPTIVGGAERSVQFLAEALVGAGNEVVVISLSPRHGVESTSHNGVVVYKVGHWSVPWPFRQGGLPWFLKPYYFALDSFYNPFICRDVGKIIAREQPDVVHSNNIFGFSPQIWKSVQKLDIPLVHTLRDYSLLCTRSTMWKSDNNCQNLCLPCRIHAIRRRMLSRNVSGLVGISNFILNQHLNYQFFEMVETKEIIYNQSATTDSIPYFSTGSKGDSIDFGYLGRIEKEKGVEILLDSFSAVASQYECKLFIGGDGDAIYKNTLRERYPSPTIQFLGFIDPHTLFSKIDVLIVPSLWNEPLGRVVLEAYQYGIPVIGSSTGGLLEIIEEGETGFLFDPKTSDSLTEKLYLACNNRQQLRDMRPSILKLAKKFTPEFIVGQYLQLYQDVICQYHVQHRNR